MKIAILTRHNTRDVKSWSGAAYYMAKSFEDKGIEVDRIDQLPATTRQSQFVMRVLRKITKKTYYADRTPQSIALTSREAQQRLNKSSADIVLTTQYPPIAFLETQKPIVFWNDAVFAQLLGYYQNMRMPPRWHYNDIYRLEKVALQKAKALVFCSDWARNGTKDTYGIDMSKMHVVPYGSNLEVPPAFNSERKLSHGEPVRLLCVGYEWHRKGMDLACELARKLNSIGIRCQLDIVSQEFLDSSSNRDGIVFHGILRKDVPSEAERMAELYQNAHFFLFPSRAECLGLVIAEANAHSLPVIGSDAGGIPTGINMPLGGLTFSLDNWVDNAAYAVKRFAMNPMEYAAACDSAYKNFSTRLNWGNAADSMLKILANLI